MLTFYGNCWKKERKKEGVGIRGIAETNNREVLELINKLKQLWYGQ